MNSEMGNMSNMMDDRMMNLVALGLLFVVVRDGRVADMVNNTVLGLMPDLQLEDENGDSTLLGNALHAVVFVGLWYLLTEFLLN